MVLLMVVLSAVGLAPTPASAASQGFTLTMVGGQGRVILGKSPDTPLVISDPSRITGTVDDVTGAITGASLSTPPIHFTQQITSPVVADVAITATFSDTTPNSGTGQVDGLGNVSLTTSLDLALHIDVADGLMVGDCQSAPIVLNFVSPEPYDPETEEVTLVDPGFAIPAVVESPTCPSLLVGPINDQLSSPSNSITLGFTGTLPLPPPPGEPSTTALASDVTSTPLGHPVTFTATVAPPEATGTVTFLSGANSFAIVPVGEGGVATLTTTTLPVGEHQVTARYSGDLDHRPSTSAPVAHTVTAIPNLAANLPTQLVVGAAATEFTATVSNPASGEAQSNLRVDVLLGRVGTATTLTAAMLTLEYHDGSTWVPIELARRLTPPPADLTGTLAGSYGGLTGFALAPGQTRQVPFRIAAAANAVQGVMAVQFKVNTVDAEGAVVTTFSTTTASVPVVPATRRPTTVAITTGAGAEIRQGFGVRFQASVTRGGATPLPNIAGGRAEVLIDGQPRVAFSSALDPSGLSLPVGTSGSVTFNVLPSETRDLAPGTHRVSVRFLGDVVYQPSLSAEVTITVHAQAQPAYECTFLLAIIGASMGARVDVHGNLPAAAPAGTTLSPVGLDISATIENNPSGFPVGDVVEGFNLYLADTPEAVTPIIDVSPEGSSGTYAGLVAGTPTAPPAPPEATLTLVAPTLSIPIAGEPGDVIDVDLERFGYDITIDGVSVSYTCVPVGDPVSLGSIVVAGTVVEASTAGPVEEGQAVTLTASVFPSSAQGMVEFFDGSTSLGFAPVSAGRAVLPTTALPQGTRSITARHLGDLVNPVTTSAPVQVTVRDVILCKNQTGTETGAVVRAAYLTLLGRCAEPGGFAYWRGRLDGGLSAESFARQIAGSLEAHARSVDDAYQLVLGRPAEDDGRIYWAHRLGQGRRYDALVGDLAASSEFWAAAGSSNTGFVERLYDRLLGRSASTADRNYWVGRLQGGESRASLAATLVRLDEPTGTLVRAAYQAILDRAPTGEELAPAVTAFRRDGSRARVYAALIGTEEFRERAQGFPNA